MKMTTCLRCKRTCTQRELDAYYECFFCQDEFLEEMDAISSVGAKVKRDPTYLKNFSEALQIKIAKDATSLYRIQFHNQQQLLTYLYKKYRQKVTLFNYKKITCDQNLHKWGLTWKYKNKKNT